jgi:hypothetical protein
MFEESEYFFEERGASEGRGRGGKAGRQVGHEKARKSTKKRQGAGSRRA